MTAPLSLCYLNDRYVPLAEARISPLDRGFLFGDAVYEVIPCYRGRPFRLRAHLDRLNRSLAGIRMTPPLSHEKWAEICVKLATQEARGSERDAYVYLQVSRGTESSRNHAWSDNIEPTLFGYATSLEPAPERLTLDGVSAITAREIRWARRDIKSTALLANVLLKKLAADRGDYETILLENGELTEGSSTTVHVVTNGIIHTPPNGRHILPGTTRDVVTELAARLGVPAVSGNVSEQSLRSADEVWLAFSTRGVLPVTRIDGQPVGMGIPGPLFSRMHQAFTDYIAELAGTPVLEP